MVTSARAVTFELQARDGQARAGKLHTRRGTVLTPAFMPVGTAGSVKGVLPWQLRELGAQIVLANTYHLHLRPGEEVVRQLGGIGGFSGWDGPVLTDSGGYQVFSHADRRTIDEQGVTFRDHIEGRARELTPESVVRIQEALGADIMMPLDDCTGHPTERDQAAQAMQRTLRWLPRAVEARADATAGLFGIVQGGSFEDLREESLRRTTALDLDGYALGGVSVGEGREQIRRIVGRFGPRLPADRPRYLMGIGLPEDIVAAVAAGFDLFDCVVPTRHARNAQLFTSRGRINVRNARFRTESGPIDHECGCPVCGTLSLGYIRHLYVSGELLSSVAGTLHNLWFYLDLLRQLREAIFEGDFATKVQRLASSGRIADGAER